MKYFTVGIICIVLGLFISSLKEAEMKSLDRVDIQDGKVRTIKDPITGLKGIIFSSFSGNNISWLNNGYDISNTIWNSKLLYFQMSKREEWRYPIAQTTLQDGASVIQIGVVTNIMPPQLFEDAVKHVKVYLYHYTDL